MRAVFMGTPEIAATVLKSVLESKHEVIAVVTQTDKPKGRGVDVNISVSCFVPKAHTPFQWFGQDTIEELVRKQKHLGMSIHSGKIRYNWHEAKVSFIEAVFARGDRRLSKAVVEAFNQGQYFDGWGEYFSYDRYMNIFEKSGIDPSFYANRRMGFDEILPWAHMDSGVTQKFLLSEAKKALGEETMPDCLTKCSGCGAAKFGSDLCTKHCITPNKN